MIWKQLSAGNDWQEQKQKSGYEKHGRDRAAEPAVNSGCYSINGRFLYGTE